MAIEVDFRANLTDAQRSMVDFYKMQEKVDTEFKQMAKDAAAAEKAAARAFKQSEKDARAAKDQVGGVKNEMTGVEKAAAGAARSAANWIKGFIGISGIVMAVRSVTAELKEQIRLQSEMLGTAVDIDRMAQGLAALKSGGLTPGNVAAARQEIQNLSIQTSTSMDTARQALFFGYSAYGDTASGRSAALTTAKVSATGQLSPDQIAALPGLFKVMGADTEAKQMAAVNRMVTATKSSIAETAPYIPEFTTLYPIMKGAGFGYEESLAMFNASIMASAGNVPEAGTRLQAAVKYAAYPSKEAESYLTQQARKRGLNFSAMQPRERVLFTGEVYRKAMSENKMTQFGGAFGTKAMQGFGGLFTPEAQSEFQRAMGLVAGTDMEMVQKDFAGYLATLPARQTARQTQATIGQASIGREKESVVAFWEKVEAIQKQIKAGGTVYERAAMLLMPGSMERSAIAYQLVGMGLETELQGIRRGGITSDEQARYERLRGLYLNPSYAMTQDYVSQVMAETEGLTNITPGRTYGAEYGFMKGIERFFQEMTTAIRENTQALNRLGGPVPVE